MDPLVVLPSIALSRTSFPPDIEIMKLHSQSSREGRAHSAQPRDKSLVRSISKASQCLLSSSNDGEQSQ